MHFRPDCPTVANVTHNIARVALVTAAFSRGTFLTGALTVTPRGTQDARGL